jgi:hypothetical protein
MSTTIETPQSVSITHQRGSYPWSVGYTSHTVRGTSSTFEDAWTHVCAEVNSHLAPPAGPTAWNLSGMLPAVAGPI